MDCPAQQGLDFTKYLEDHPGGTAILIEVADIVATEAFDWKSPDWTFR